MVGPGGSLAVLEFGSIGRLDAAQQSALRQAILGIALRNPTILSDALLVLSRTIETVDIDAFDRLSRELDDVEVLHEMAREVDDATQEADIDAAAAYITSQLDQLDLRRLFFGEHAEAD